MVEVSVVIPNFNGENFLPACLNSLRKQTVRDFQTIVVDNGSTDKSVELLKESYTDFQLIELGENTGFCKAVNVGIQASEAPYVILLNNDTEAKEDFVEELLKGIKRYKGAFSCGAKMVNFHGRNIIDNAGNYYNALGWAFARGEGKSIDDYVHSIKVFATCGGAAIYRKEVFDIIGYFDEEHFAYLEDIDICYRAKINGYTNRFLPNAVVYHVGSGTSGSKHNAFKVRLSSKNNLYMIYKNMPIIQLILNMPLLVAGFAIKLAFFLKKGLGKEYVLGLKDGISTCIKSDKKVVFSYSNLRNYIGIQFELWGNILRRIIN